MSSLFRLSLSTKKFSELILTSKVVQKLPTLQIKRSLGESLRASGQTPKERKIIGYWLLGCAGLTYATLGLGGLTRLTESGLSMVKWDLFRTMKPPFSEAEWEREFENYKAYPEYKYKSSTEEMTLSQFKSIWTMEYLHRMLGRGIGLTFLIPCAYFWFRGRFNNQMKIRMGIAGALILAQGAIGWHMVKSGLDPSKNSDKEIPRVSQYRLVAHLGMAYVLYTIYLWCGLSHVFTPFDHSKVAGITKLRGMTHGTKTVILLTILMGGFVAGLDAGLVYNTWPKFAGKWVPNEVLSKSPTWRNLTENQVTVQFIHRHLAYLTVVSITLTWLVGRRLNLNRRAKIALHSLMLMGYTQATLGILTLINYVPVWLASLHQNGSVSLVTLVFWLSNEIRRIPK